MVSVPSAELIAGKGVVGDRYCSGNDASSKKWAGLPDFELTHIEHEEIDGFNSQLNYQYGYGQFRRNIVTSGARLNELVGKDFTLGNLRVRGIRLFEPCAHLANMLTQDFMPELVHRVGLRAQIVTSGTIKVGNQVASR